MADEECPLAVERIGILGADVSLKMEQSLRDAGAPLAQAGGSVRSSKARDTSAQPVQEMWASLW